MKGVKELYKEIRLAYKKQWGEPESEIVPSLPKEVLSDFPNIKILIFPPSRFHHCWIYSTIGMYELCSSDNYLSEVFIFSEVKDDEIVEALSNLINYVQTECIEYGKIFPCGKNLDNYYTCSHLLCAFPLSDGDNFPELYFEDKEICFIWLVPIDDKEVNYILSHGHEEFEEKFFEKSFNDFTWSRKSFV